MSSESAKETSLESVLGNPTKGFLENLYEMQYRQGMNPHPMTKKFHMVHTGTFQERLRAAISRGRRHCEITGLRFISVRPFLSDLTMDEKHHVNPGEEISQ